MGYKAWQKGVAVEFSASRCIVSVDVSAQVKTGKNSLEKPQRLRDLFLEALQP